MADIIKAFLTNSQFSIFLVGLIVIGISAAGGLSNLPIPTLKARLVIGILGIIITVIGLELLIPNNLVIQILVVIVGGTAIAIALVTFRSQSDEGVNLTGRWKERNGDYTYETDLKQSAQRLSGTTKITTSGGTPGYPQDFTVTGQIQPGKTGFLILNFISATKTSTSIATALLKMYDERNVQVQRLKGIWVYKKWDGEVASEEIDWKRVDS